MIVDLVAVGAACRPLLAWYDKFDRTGNGEPAELQRAVACLAALPPVSGRLGGAIRLIVTGGSSNPDATLAAIALLRRVVPLPAPGSEPPRPGRRIRAAHGASYDCQLPGLDGDDEDGRPT